MSFGKQRALASENGLLVRPWTEFVINQLTVKSIQTYPKAQCYSIRNQLVAVLKSFQVLKANDCGDIFKDCRMEAEYAGCVRCSKVNDECYGTIPQPLGYRNWTRIFTGHQDR